MPALVVGGDRHGLDRPLDLLGVEALLGEPLAGEPGDHLLRARAGGHALGLDAGQRPRPPLRGDRGAEQRVDLLGPLPGGRGGHRLRVARRDRDLGPQPALALAHPLGDVGGEDLGAEGLAQHDLVDRLADDLLEARHVDAGLPGIEVDEALELGVVEVLGAVGLDPDHLLDPGHADPREADLGRGDAGLDVGRGGGDGRSSRLAIELMKGKQLGPWAPARARRPIALIVLPILRRSRSLGAGSPG